MNDDIIAVRIVRHIGVSFVAGLDNVHFWLTHPNENLIRERWFHLLVSVGLADDLHLECDAAGYFHGFAKTYIFLPLGIIHRVINCLWVPDDERDAELREQLATQVAAANQYSRSYGLYYRIAQLRGWVGMPLLLGSKPAIFLGIGKFSRLLVMNLDPTISTVIGSLGNDKAYCRSLLQAYGLKVAPGALALTVSEAKARAIELGFPLALKVAQGGSDSYGVILGIDSEQACIDAASELLLGGHMLVIERMVQGVELRLHFIRGQLFSILKSEAYVVKGDGETNLEGLLAQQHSDYLKAMMGSTYNQNRLIFQLYCLGVRKISDLARIVPPLGAMVRVSAATGGKNMTKLAPSAIDDNDKRALEAFLARYGSPSAGIDIILPYLGAALSEGGAILEINIPCGLGYLGDEAARAADLEVLNSARRCEGFVEARSRVPVAIAVCEQFPANSTQRSALIAHFSQRHSDAQVAILAGANGWLQILTETSACAFLVFVDDEAIVEHGMPAHLQPNVLYAGKLNLFKQNWPKIAATAINAGASFIAVDEFMHQCSTIN